MKVSPSGRKFIEQEEGCRLHAYQDTVGVWTIGYGHSSMAGHPHVYANSRITQAEADTILSSDLAPTEHTVNTFVKAPLTQNQFDACCSLCFNIGGGAFSHSTVVHRLNAKDYPGAARAFEMWEHPSGLAGRRHREVALFRKPDSVSPHSEEAGV